MRFRAEMVPIVVVMSTGSALGLATTSCKGDRQAQAVDAEGRPIVIKRSEDIPPMMGGAPMPITEQQVQEIEQQPPSPPTPANAPSPSPASPAPASPAAAAPAPASPAAPSPASPEPSDRTPTAAPVALRIGHNHPPGEACNRLTRAEVEKALGDLKRKK